MYAAKTTLSQFIPIHRANDTGKAVLLNRETAGSLKESIANLCTTNINCNGRGAYIL